MSPDAFAQMAFQLAHKRTRGFVGATYESISMRQFHHGRTEAMRVVTTEVVEFTNAMDDPRTDLVDRRAALPAAAARHVERTKQCRERQAPEQHLWELELRQRRGDAPPGGTEADALYDSPGWLRMRDDYLSTGSAPSNNVQYGGFGPTSSHRIGIGYMLLPDRLNIHLSTPRTGADALHVFTVELQSAISELEALLSCGASSAQERCPRL
jgi:carnitine O-acetyltransferase